MRRSLDFKMRGEGCFPVTKWQHSVPNYFCAVGDTGILLEVERGKTTTNNMDFLDFWKCHVCPRANYLFLLVPQQLRHNDSMRPKREFAAVERRLSSFFHVRNATNVRACFVYRY